MDDAKINHIIIKGDVDSVEYDLVDNKPSFFNMATCHSYFKVKTFNYEAMINNTVAFHFVPGCKGENFSKKLRCTEESQVILDILDDVLHDNDLIKLGIVLHAYADTFSHQGFSGVLSKVNDIIECDINTKGLLVILNKIIEFFKQLNRCKYEKLFDSVVPAYGHGQAMNFPDIPYLNWHYTYDYSDEFQGSYKVTNIDNKDRYIRAFTNIQKHLDRYLKNHPQYVDKNVKFENFDILMNTLVAKMTDRNREKNWRNILIKQGLFNVDDSYLITYDDNRWLQEAFTNFEPRKFHERNLEEVELADGFSNSHWYQFYLATKWYKNRFFEYCSKYQLDIPR